MSPPALIGVDWGTSSFRAALMDPEGRVLERMTAATGILEVSGGDFEIRLRELLGPWLDAHPGLPIVLSGMVTSRQGWLEVPYLPCPVTPERLADALAALDLQDGQRLRFVPGLSTRRPDGLPDVMRGEETQILGALAEMPEARTLPAISFAEATELAYFGAKVIHPRTMQPAAERGIPIWIKNTFRPEHPGTRIGPDTTQDGSVVKAITAIPGVSVITVEGSGFLSVADVTARVFDTVGETGVNVYMIFQASSQHSLGFVVRQADTAKVLAALEQEFELDLLKGRVLRIWEDPNLAVVAVVGAGMRGTPGVAGRVFQTLGQNRINIVAIAQGSSELNISFVIAEHEVSRAVPAIHAAFGLGNARDA